MNLYELTFYVTIGLALPFWAAMILAPGWSVTRRVLGSVWPVLLLALPYTLLELPYYVNQLPELIRPRFDTLAELVRGHNEVSLVWLHLLAVDFLAGRWIYLDSRERGLHPLIMAPVLTVCGFFAPAGLAIYLVLRTGWPARHVTFPLPAPTRTP